MDKRSMTPSEAQTVPCPAGVGPCRHVMGGAGCPNAEIPGTGRCIRHATTTRLDSREINRLLALAQELDEMEAV